MRKMVHSLGLIIRGQLKQEMIFSIIESQQSLSLPRNNLSVVDVHSSLTSSSVGGKIPSA